MCVADVEKERDGTSAVKQKAGNGGVKEKVARVVCNCACTHTHATSSLRA